MTQPTFRLMPVRSGIDHNLFKPTMQKPKLEGFHPIKKFPSDPFVPSIAVLEDEMDTDKVNTKYHNKRGSPAIEIKKAILENQSVQADIDRMERNGDYITIIKETNPYMDSDESNDTAPAKAGDNDDISEDFPEDKKGDPSFPQATINRISAYKTRLDKLPSSKEKDSLIKSILMKYVLPITLKHPEIKDPVSGKAIDSQQYILSLLQPTGGASIAAPSTSISPSSFVTPKKATRPLSFPSPMSSTPLKREESFEDELRAAILSKTKLSPEKIESGLKKKIPKNVLTEEIEQASRSKAQFASSVSDAQIIEFLRDFSSDDIKKIAKSTASFPSQGLLKGDFTEPFVNFVDKLTPYKNDNAKTREFASKLFAAIKLQAFRMVKPK